MIFLDTDHVSVLKMPPSIRQARLLTRMNSQSGLIFGVPVAAVEEVMRGWLATLAKERITKRQIPAYRELGDLFRFFAQFEIIPFDDPAADQFGLLQKQKIRIGSSDLKIASTALVNKSLLLTANTRDFSQVPGLRFENWLD
jgi:tRNA(fMet)-specific endonuclease VapC